MKNAIKDTTSLVIALGTYANEGRRFNKRQRQIAKQRAKYDKMIAKSQAKIGPYVPTTCPVQIWA